MSSLSTHNTYTAICLSYCGEVLPDQHGHSMACDGTLFPDAVHLLVCLSLRCATEGREGLRGLARFYKLDE